MCDDAKKACIVWLILQLMHALLTLSLSDVTMLCGCEESFLVCVENI